MKKKIPLLMMVMVLILCIAGYLGIKDMEWEDTGNPNATTIENSQTISEAIEEASVSSNAILEETIEEE